jgi:ribonucleoside-diphosphate reductase alpha chain
LALRAAPVKRAERHRLRDRRPSISFLFASQGVRFTGSYSRFDDGSVGEIFMNDQKPGSSAGVLANEAAIAASLALQFGCPFETLAHALPHDASGKPSGPLGAALDFIAKDSDHAS